MSIKKRGIRVLAQIVLPSLDSIVRIIFAGGGRESI